MSCYCGEKFRTAEDYRDHLPCSPPSQRTATVDDFRALRPGTVKVLEQIMRPTMVEMVKEFHDKFGIRHDPKIEDEHNANLRLDLIEEEWLELQDAVRLNEGKEAVADALGDILYVTLGAAESWGIDIERVFAEIHRSNMTKEGGGKRADGKILKGPNYSPPDLSFVLEG